MILILYLEGFEIQSEYFLFLLKTILNVGSSYAMSSIRYFIPTYSSCKHQTFQCDSAKIPEK